MVLPAPRNESLALLSTTNTTLEDLVSKAEGYALLARAPSTNRAYYHDWEHFRTWCESRNIAPVPASAKLLGLYISDQACLLSVATIERRLSGIAAVQRQMGINIENDHPYITKILDGIRRAHGSPPASKRALTLTELCQMIERLPRTIQGIRDRALFLLGFSGALRRSELCGLDVLPGGPGTGWIEFCSEGIVIAIRYSKENQKGKHIEQVAVPSGKSELTCAVKATQMWLEISGVTAGPLFRSVLKSGRVTEQRLGEEAVARRIKAAVVELGIDPALVSGHSLRSGFVTAAAAAGRSEYDIMRHTRHKSCEMVRRYIRPNTLFQDSLAASMSL